MRNVSGTCVRNGQLARSINNCTARTWVLTDAQGSTQAILNSSAGVAATVDDYECSDDWLAHEFTHAYTQHTCNLQYANESGALNESFSDVFAAFITGDWLCFEDAWLKASAPAWRNMIDPTNGGQWDNSTDTNAINSVFAGHNPHHYSVRYTGAFDGGGVHVNSSIINHLFYLLTVGGTHALSGITVTGIGQAAAEQMLFRCMAINLVGNPTANFLDFREAMLDTLLACFLDSSTEMPSGLVTHFCQQIARNNLELSSLASIVRFHAKTHVGSK